MIWFARALSFTVGFLSLSQEILWIRLAGFAFRGAPQAFSVVLGIFLIGIAAGAAVGKYACASGKRLLFVAGAVLVTAAVLDAVLPWVAAYGFNFGRAFGSLFLGAGVFLTAALKSILFPIAHHLGSTAASGQVGRSVSKVYFANIVGSTLGPLVTGFVLLQLLTLQQCFMLMCGLTLLTGCACLIAGSELKWPRYAYPPLAAAFVAGLLLLPSSLIEVLVKSSGEGEGPLKTVIENRYGIIHVLHGPEGDDIVFGGNAYDGRTNIDYLRDTNWISRVYILAALKPTPRRVLVVGMSAGAWTRVLTAFPGVETIDVVEINPGYTEIASQYDELQKLLVDRRVRIHIDDGRRWLRRNPNTKFDLIVMNTSYHWRAYATFLLSAEFLHLIRQHMEEGAVVAYNSTFSPDVFRTAVEVFPAVFRYGNFVVAADRLEIPSPEEATKRMTSLELDGVKLLDASDPRVQSKIRDNLMHLEPYEKVVAGAERPLEIITDRNMITEYKYGSSITQYLRKRKSN